MATSLVQRQEEVDKILMREPKSLNQEGSRGARGETGCHVLMAEPKGSAAVVHGRRRLPGRERPSLRGNVPK